MSPLAAAVRRVLRYPDSRRLGARQGVETLLARDAEAGRPLVIKQVDAGGAPGDVLERLERTSTALRELDDPRLVAPLDVWSEDARVLVSRPFVPGAALDERLRRGPLRAAETAALGRWLMSVLAGAHAAGLVHGGVRPGNVILGPDGTLAGATLVDAGIAGAAAEPPTADGDLRGGGRAAAPGAGASRLRRAA